MCVCVCWRSSKAIKWEREQRLYWRSNDLCWIPTSQHKNYMLFLLKREWQKEEFSHTTQEYLISRAQAAATAVEAEKKWDWGKSIERNIDPAREWRKTTWSEEKRNNEFLTLNCKFSESGFFRACLLCLTFFSLSNNITSSCKIWYLTNYTQGAHAEPSFDSINTHTNTHIAPMYIVHRTQYETRWHRPI